MIPRRIFRKVPEETSAEVERFWDGVQALHPGWECVTYRDPVDPALFPLSAAHWSRCSHGAQRAGLMRLESLIHHGGVYLDGDVELYRPLDPLLYCRAFIGWESVHTVCDAVIGAEPEHPAIVDCLDLAVALIERGPYQSGPGVMTAIMPDRRDVLLLPPGSFYPYLYNRPDLRNADHRSEQPWAFGAHHWAASWVES